MSTQQWANIGDDEGAPYALLDRVAAQLPVALIDYVWIFPARRIAIGESIVVVVGAFAEETDRRRVITAHFTITRDRKGKAFVNARFDEHGSAPSSAVPRIVDGVLHRLGEDAGAPPREDQIGGSYEAWTALIIDLGGRPPTASNDEPETVAESAAPDEAQSPTAHDAVRAAERTV